MDQQRGYSDDGDQRWYNADPGWERGRHGAPGQPEEEPSYDPTARYQSGSLFDVGRRSGEQLPPVSGAPPASAPPATPAEPPRRSMEAIDVAALRRGDPPEPPAGFAAPDYPGADYAAQPSADYVPRPAVDYSAAEYPMYQAAPEAPVAGAPPAPGGLESLGLGGGAGTTYQGGSGGAISGPTSAHNTVGTYRSRRPALAIGTGIVVALLEIVAVRLLVDAVFRSSPTVAGTVGPMFLALGLPLFGVGGYALVTGAAAGAADWRVWARAPLVYLPLGIVLFVCAALAA